MDWSNMKKWILEKYQFKLIILIIIFLGNNLKTNSQTWVQKTSGTNQNLWGLEVISSNNAYVVGDQGTILFSSTGGNTWSAQTSGTTNYLNSINFYNINLGWTAGENGTILKTTNAGINWITQTNGSNSAIGGIGIISNQNVILVAANGEISLTTDGGDNWNPISSPTAQNLWSINIVNSNIAFAVGENGTIIKTTDGGNNWISQTSGISDIIWDIDFFDTNIGYAVGDNGIILKTTNSGSNWLPMSSGFVGTLYSVYIKDENTVFAVGVTGKILKTTNAGSTWFDVPSGSTTAFSRIKFYGTTGIKAGQGGEIFKYNLFPPTLTSFTTSSISSTSVTLGSAISTDGNSPITNKGFVWSTTSNPTINTNLGIISLGSGSSLFNYTISGLTHSTMYYVRAFATNSEGTSYSNEISFTTLPNVIIPNNGDGNGDGIVDSLQYNVVTLLTADGKYYITIEEVSGNTIYEVNSIESNDINSDLYYPYGLIEFKVNARQSTVKIYYHNNIYYEDMLYKKLNSNGNYYNFNNYKTSYEYINGNKVTVITLKLTDGETGDLDGAVNGIIYDPGGPAISIVAIPTLSEWAKYSLMIFMILFSVYFIKRKI